MAPDLDWVNNRIAVGGEVGSLLESRQIENKGITHVLDLRDPEYDGKRVTDEAQWFAKIGATYLNNPTPDDGEKKPADWFKKSIDFTLHALVADPASRVLIHCKKGINRAPSTAYAVLQAFGVPKNDALEHVKEARPRAKVRYAEDADRAIKKLGYKE